MDKYELVTNWLYFTRNFPHDFVERAWPVTREKDDPYIYFRIVRFN